LLDYAGAPAYFSSDIRLMAMIYFSSLFLILNYNFNDKFDLTTDLLAFPSFDWLVS